MPEDIEWDQYSAAGERPFRLMRPSGAVPGVLWSPPVAGSPPPLVLLGPGGAGLLARWFATRAGFAVLTLDEPSEADWPAAVAAIAALGLASADRLAYWGLAAGTVVGLPLVASLGPRLRCAVLGKFGLDPQTPSRLIEDAGRVVVPTLFHVQWDDEKFPKGGQLQLFALLGTTEKRLIGYPGGHDVVLPVAVAEWQAFITRYLKT